jgi:hypothetical protein
MGVPVTTMATDKLTIKPLPHWTNSAKRLFVTADSGAVLLGLPALAFG